MKWYLIVYIIFGFISLAWLYYPLWMLKVIKSNDRFNCREDYRESKRTEKCPAEIE